MPIERFGEAPSSAVEPPKDTGPKIEKEPNAEAMKKIVDFYKTEDLKYRNEDFYQIPTALEIGVPTPLTDFLKEPLSRVNETTHEKMKEISKKREEERASIKNDFEYNVVSGIPSNEYSGKTNVFYPEGLLKYLRNKNKTDLYAQVYEKVSIIKALEFLSVVVKYQLRNSQEFKKLTGITDDEIKGLSPEALHEKLLQAPPEAWEMIRRAWLYEFWRTDNNPFGGSEEFERSSKSIAEYPIRLGFVLSPDTKVALSWHSDFPTQATVMTPRIKPKEIIGFIINSDIKGDFILNNYVDEAINGPPDERPLDYKGVLEKSFFHTPEHPVEYLFAHYARPFGIFLEENGFSTEQLKSYLSEFSTPENELLNKGRGKGFQGNAKEYKKELVKAAGDVSKKFSQFIGDETYAKIEDLAKRFLETRSPLKDNDSLMEGLIRLAERYQIPIYNTQGDVLWPKYIRHKEKPIEQVTRKAEEKSKFKDKEIKYKKIFGD